MFDQQAILLLFASIKKRFNIENFRCSLFLKTGKQIINLCLLLFIQQILVLAALHNFLAPAREYYCLHSWPLACSNHFF